MSELKTISTARLMGEESRTNKYGTELWGFFIEFDDGSKGVANGASKAPKWAESGKVVEATDTGYKTPKGHVKWSISIPKDIPLPDNDGFKGHQSKDGAQTIYKKAQFSSNGGRGVDKGREIAVQACVNHGCQVAIQDMKNNGFDEERFEHVVRISATSMLKVGDALREGRDLSPSEDPF